MTAHGDPRVPQSDACVVRNLLDEHSIVGGGTITPATQIEQIPQVVYAQPRTIVVQLTGHF